MATAIHTMLLLGINYEDQFSFSFNPIEPVNTDDAQEVFDLVSKAGGADFDEVVVIENHVVSRSYGKDDLDNEDDE